MNQVHVLHRHPRRLVLGTADHFRWLAGVAEWVLVLNLLDGVFTLIWVEYFGAQEMNVMLSDLVVMDPLKFMLVKLSLVSLGILFLWRNRNKALAVIALFLAFYSYYMVLLVHLQHYSRMFL